MPRSTEAARAARRAGNQPADAAAAVPATKIADLWLGQHLRGLRKMHDLSLEQLAERCGLSVGALSQIERGLTSPTMRSLRRLSEVFNVPMSQLFHEGDLPPVEELGRIVRAQGRRVLSLNTTGVQKELLTPAANGALEIYLVTIAPGGSSGPELYTHKGEEGGYVMAGEMVLEIEDRVFHLKTGDSFRFKSQTPHRFANETTQETVVVWTNVVG
ncbi:XRE family transcriptional regulator [Dongia mobilis]|uniref:XRE family transcriptional regulator n=1 Tax=Dongia mobilis TaxID=578943 RepID=A0A4R6WT93_9PROT|nr:cupin domain-containing protein [Dongia mobilis]TDQ86449.1 XRE family transcriptional regulator [Dongia mobilis]